VRALVDRHLAEGSFPGIVLVVRKCGRTVCSLVRGHRQIHPRKLRMAEDTLFDLASLTKPLATAHLLLRSLERQHLPVDSRLGAFIAPADPALGEVTLLELLTHTSGVPATADFVRHFPDPRSLDPEPAEQLLLSVEPSHPRGERVLYSCTGYMLLGLVLKAITGMRLRDLWERMVCDELGVSGSCFNPPPSLQSRAATTENCPWRGRWIRGEVHDESSFCMGGDAGNAGLFATASGVLSILDILGLVDPSGSSAILSPESRRLMSSCLTRGGGQRRSAGFCMQGPQFPFGSRFSRRALGHTGFTGTSVLVDPEAGLEIVTLTNRVHLGREATAAKIVRFRTELHELLHELHAQ
jgi:CubicO group peptidase (beta-lactamase class C family)